MTKVLHLIDSAGFYGAERVVVTLLELLRESDFPGVLGCIGEDASAMPAIGHEARRRGVSVVSFTIGRGFRLGGVKLLRTYIRKEGIRLVHSHGYKPDIYLGFLPGRHLRKISTVHGWSKSVGGAKLRLYESLDALSLRFVDKVVAVSEGVRRDLAVRGLRTNVAVIHNGIVVPEAQGPDAKDAGRARYGLPKEADVIGTLGRLVPIKGLEFLVRAMPSILKERPNCHLCMAGEGPLREELQGLADSLGIGSRVHLIGYVSDPGPFLAMNDIFFMPSLSEGLPLALLEAMSLGVAVVASRVGGVPEVICDGHDGMLTEAGNSSSLGRAATTLLSDPSQARRLALNARETVIQRFSAPVMAENYLRLYRDISGAGGSAWTT